MSGSSSLTIALECAVQTARSTSGMPIISQMIAIGRSCATVPTKSPPPFASSTSSLRFTTAAMYVRIASTRRGTNVDVNSLRTRGWSGGFKKNSHDSESRSMSEPGGQLPKNRSSTAPSNGCLSIAWTSL